MENKKIFIIHSFTPLSYEVSRSNEKVDLIQYLTYPNNLFHRGAKFGYDFG